ncbi:MAG: hypothetical protein H7Y00_15675 [Fimbriimonadaceae bacterium]|nr:hypothetical protein [Chitinophagales bacterium]
MSYYRIITKCNVLFIALFLISSCELTPGEGGTSSITGKVFVHELNSSGIVIAEYYSTDEKVFILYDEDSIFDEETSTSFNGEYQFKFLRKGNYRIFSYSDINSFTNEQEQILVEVEITENNQEVTAAEIVIERR